MENRRDFVATTIAALSGSIAIALFVPAFRYLLLTQRAKELTKWVKVADIAKIDGNQPMRVEFEREVVDGWVTSNESSSAWIVKPLKGVVIAFAPQCTHLGCAYFWDSAQEHFNCPCHGSTFGKDGSVKQGPANRSLDRYATRIEGQDLLIQPTPIQAQENS